MFDLRSLAPCFSGSARAFVLGMSLAALAACGDDGKSEPEIAGRGTAACKSWQDSLCDAVSRCGFLDKTECLEQYRTFECKSDEQASLCATELEQASCSSGPKACDFFDVADPEPAIAGCEEYLDRSCGHLIECGAFATMTDCETEVGIDCDGAYGRTLSFEQCLKDIDTLSCSAQKFPASCEGTIIADQ